MKTRFVVVFLHVVFYVFFFLLFGFIVWFYAFKFLCFVFYDVQHVPAGVALKGLCK